MCIRDSHSSVFLRYLHLFLCLYSLRLTATQLDTVQDVYKRQEKHCDWLVEAVVKAKESVPDISLDIYGKGGDEAKLKGLIGRLGCACLLYTSRCV